MHLALLAFSDFRNLEDGTIRLAPGRNVVLGANGQGKSNLLEAVTVLTTLRSFRTPHLARAARHGSAGFRLRGRVERPDGPCDLALEMVFRPERRRVLHLDRRPVPPPVYLAAARVEVLTGRGDDLVFGEPGVRRAFLDRLAFHREPAVYETFRRYRRLLAQRNAWLRQGGRGAEGAAWERALAEAGAAVVGVRRRTVEALRPVFEGILRDVAGGRIGPVELAYRAESWLPDGTGTGELAETYEMMYDSARERDGRLGFTGYGPHRHDLVLTRGGRAAAETLSAGQGKLVAAALRLAAVELIEGSDPPGGRGVVLMDDPEAELDDRALGALLERVGRGRQVIVTSPRDGSALLGGGDVTVFRIREGRVLPPEDRETVDDGTVHG